MAESGDCNVVVEAEPPRFRGSARVCARDYSHIHACVWHTYDRKRVSLSCLSEQCEPSSPLRGPREPEGARMIWIIWIVPREFSALPLRCEQRCVYF